MSIEIGHYYQAKSVEQKYRTVSDQEKVDLHELGNFIANQSTGNFFQSPYYLEFYNSLKGYDTILVCAYDQNDKIAGSVICVINRLVSGFKLDFLTRAIVVGGPVVGDQVKDRNAVMRILISKLIDVVNKKSVYLEFRNSFDMYPYRIDFEKNKLAFHEHLNFIVDCTNREQVWKRLNNGKQRQIKKALAAGAEICVAKDISEVKEFYKLLVYLYKTRVKKPLPDWSFFEKFFTQKNKLGIYIVIKYEGKIVGGMMCPLFANRIIYEWYVAGEDRDHKNIYPSVLATWAGIEYGVANNIGSFDFMGAGKPKQEYGVREFKAQFGGDLKNFGRYTRILNKRKYDFSQWLLKKFGYFK